MVMCKEMETSVIVAKINACIMPTNNSSIKNGNGTMYGAKNEIIVNKTSPAKTFPNSLKDNEIILANSDIISKIPMKKLIGLLKFKYFPICLKLPTAVMPKMLVTITEITANANVKFKSAAGERKSGTSTCPLSNINDPTPGKIPNKFEHKIKIKIVATNGKYFSAFSIEPNVELIKLSSASMPISTAACNFPGTVLIVLLKSKDKIIRAIETTRVVKSPLVNGKFPIWNNCWAFNDISSIAK
jgi:hypothetical protein